MNVTATPRQHPGEDVKIVILAFAQARDTLGFSDREVTVTSRDTPRTLLLRLRPGTDLACWRAALDQEFTSWDEPIGTARELAILPPVSGG